ncbi:MAG: CapA family protein, partial [Prevotella sp.]|nr:CapA family protein [Prevotella sp.]
MRRMFIACWLLWSAVANSSFIHAQTITLTGDILLDRGVRHRIRQVGIDSLFSPAIDSVFAQSDVVVGNLECPATEIRTPAMKKFVFRADAAWLHDLRRHGITHLNLANNHSVDQRRGGL